MNAALAPLEHMADVWWAYVAHSAWQSALIGLAALCVVGVFRRWPSPVRYWILVIALAKFAVPPLWSAPTGVFSRVDANFPQSQAKTHDRGSRRRFSDSRHDTRLVRRAAVAENRNEQRKKEPPLRTPRANTEPTADHRRVAATSQQPPAVRMSRHSTEPSVATASGTKTSVEAAQIPSASETDEMTQLATWKVWLMLLHAVGIAFCTGWTFRQLWSLRRLVKNAEPVRPGRLIDLFAEQRRQFGLRCGTRLLISNDVQSPLAFGVFRPTVIVPSALNDLGRQDQETILAHELAHLQRGDPWINWVQIVTCVVWWFHPVAWLINGALRRTREDCCDDLLLSHNVTSDDGYCRTLLLVAARLNGRENAGLTLGIMQGAHPLARRLKRIMDSSLRRRVRLSALGVAVMIGLSTVILPGVRSQSQQLIAQQVDPERNKRVDQEVHQRKAHDKQPDPQAAEKEVHQDKDGQPDTRPLTEWTERQLLAFLWAVSDRASRQQTDMQAFVGGTLALLNSSPQRPTVRPPTKGMYSSDHLARLARYRWPLREGESVRQLLNRTFADHNLKSRGLYKAYWEVGKQYRSRANKPSRFDWQPKREFWFGLIESIVKSQKADDPSVEWKTKIADDPDNATLYRYAYMEALRTVNTKAIDLSIVEPLLAEKDVHRNERWRRLCLVASLIYKTATGIKQTTRDKFENKLVQHIKSHRLHAQYALFAQRELFDRCDSRQRTRLIRTLIKHQYPDRFSYFVRSIGISDAQRRQMYLATHTSVDFKSFPPEVAVSILTETVHLPLWIDESTFKDKSLITLKMSGTWLEVLEATLAQTRSRAFFLNPDILWIGPPEKAHAVRHQVRTTLARATQLQSFATQAMEVEFQDTPWQKALEFMSELHNVSILTLWSDQVPDRGLNLLLDDVPAYLVLSIIEREVGLVWRVVDNTIVFAPKKLTAALDATIAGYRHQRIDMQRLQLEDNPLATVLEKDSDTDFSDTRLDDVCAELSELHNISIVVAPFEHNDEKINLELSDKSLALTMTLMLAETGLNWKTDGNLVVIGDPATLARFHRESKQRLERRKKYPKTFAAKSRQLLTFDIGDKSVAAILTEIRDKSGVIVRLESGLMQLANRKTGLKLRPLPLDIALDVLAVHLNATWSFGKSGEVVLSPHR